MRYEKANKLLLLCAQATFGTPLIVHNYSRLAKLFQRYMVQESISICRLLWRPDKVLCNWCSGHFFWSESWQLLIKQLQGHLFLTVNLGTNNCSPLASCVLQNYVFSSCSVLHRGRSTVFVVSSVLVAIGEVGSRPVPSHQWSSKAY